MVLDSVKLNERTARRFLSPLGLEGFRDGEAAGLAFYEITAFGTPLSFYAEKGGRLLDAWRDPGDFSDFCETLAVDDADENNE